ncbi:MAG TPA: hypothetical protein VF384_00900 [Planctomycetota bacterium]
MNQKLLGTTALLLAAATASAQWHQVTPTASPTARGGAGAAFDPMSGNLIMFGGDTGAFPSPASNQTWSYNGTTWSQLTPATSPTGKVGMQLVHDQNRGVFVMFGSVNTSAFGGASVNQHWEFDGATWTQIFPTTTPGGLGNYGACFDLVRNKVVLYGGTANSMFPIAESNTWEYDGTNWAQVTTAGSPGPLERPAMCFHAGIARTVMFGGIDPQIGGVDTTWLYDGTNWIAAPVSGPKPSARTGARMVYDIHRNVCVLTGGADPMTGNPIVDSWEFDGASWKQVQSVTTGRRDAMLVYMPNRQRVVQFGGIAGFSYLGDTWEYARPRVIGSGCIGSNGVPALDAAIAPRLGQNYVQDLTNLNPAVSLGLIVLSLQEIPPVALDFLGMTGCFAYVAPDVMVTLTGIGSTASYSLAIPLAPSLIGTQLVSQGISVDPTGNPAWLVASNGLGGMIGQ